MKRLPALLSCLFLAAMLLAPAVQAVPMADPVTLSLDNPNQVTAAPSSGVTTLSFSGTVTIDPNYTPFSANADAPYNSSSTLFLSGMFDPAFLAFFFPGTSQGTYTGTIFTLDVPAGTPPDFYGYQFMTSNLSLLKLGVVVFDDKANVVNGSLEFFAQEAFSVTVTNGNQVPESGGTLLLLGASVVGICCVRRSLA
jgi:hypothetical protein